MLSPVKAFGRQRLTLKLLFVLLLGTSFYLSILEPLLKENAAMNRQIEQSRKQLIRYKQLIKEGSMIEQAYARAFSSRREEGAADPSISALKQLEEITKKSLIKVAEMRQADSSGAGEPGEILIELKLEARKEDYVKFIYDLGSSQLLFNIRDFNLKAKEDSSLLEANFRVSYILTR